MQISFMTPALGPIPRTRCGYLFKAAVISCIIYVALEIRELVKEAKLHTAIVWVQNRGSSHKDLSYIFISPSCCGPLTLRRLQWIPGQSDLSLSAVNILSFSTFLKLQICSALTFPPRGFLCLIQGREASRQELPFLPTLKHTDAHSPSFSLWLIRGQSF